MITVGRKHFTIESTLHTRALSVLLGQMSGAFIPVPPVTACRHALQLDTFSRALRRSVYTRINISAMRDHTAALVLLVYEAPVPKDAPSAVLSLVL
jgi:hypothetical protein